MNIFDWLSFSRVEFTYVFVAKFKLLGEVTKNVGKFVSYCGELPCLCC